LPHPFASEIESIPLNLPMALSRVLAVDTGAGHVASGTFGIAKGGRLSLSHFSFGSFNSDAAADAQWNRAVAQALGSGKGSSKLTGAAAAVIPGHLTLVKFIKTPSVEKSKRAKIIEFEVQQNLPYDPQEVVWGCHTVSDDGLDIDLLLAASKINVAEGLCTALTGAGIKPQCVIPSVYALYRAFKYNQPSSEDSDLVIAIGARSTHLLFLDKGRYLSRTIPLAGNNVTQAVADEIKQDFAHAEALKVQVLSGRSELAESSPARKAVAGAAQTFINQLQAEITRSLLSFRRQSGAELPARVHVTGGGSLLPNLTEVLSEKLKLPVERFDPLKNVDVAAGASDARERSAILADLVGAAIIRSEKKSALNLLPPSLVAAAAFQRQQPFYVLAAAALVLALAVPVSAFYQTTQTAKGKLENLNVDLNKMQKFQSAIDANEAKLNAAMDQINGIRDLGSSMANWINFFTDLQDRLTKSKDVWLDNLKVVRIDPSEHTLTSPAAADGAAVPSATLRLVISGRLLDKAHPLELVTAGSDNSKRVRDLINSIATSPFILSKQKESFDSSEPGILKFEFSLDVNPKKPL
jgi:type IV pilus assembly protein PilM